MPLLSASARLDCDLSNVPETARLFHRVCWNRTRRRPTLSRHVERRADDPEYIVRLVGQVVRVSLETVRIVAGLPVEYAKSDAASPVTAY